MTFARATLLCALLALASSAAVHAQAARPPESAAAAAARASALAPQPLERKIAALEAAEEMDGALKKRLLELYRAALGNLQAAQSYRLRARAFAQAVETGPEALEKLGRELAVPQTIPDSELDLDLPDGVAAAQLEQRLAKARVALAATTSELAALDKQIKEQRERPPKLRAQISAAKQKQRALEAQLGAPQLPDESPELQEAMWIALQSQVEATAGELEMLDQELLSHDLRHQLQTLRRDRVGRQASHAAARVKLLEQALNQQRRREADRAKAAAERAKREAAGKHPAVRRLAEVNAELSQQLASLTREQQRLAGLVSNASERTKQVEQEYAISRQRVEIAGLSGALGRVLLEQRKRLVERESQITLAGRKLHDQIAEAGLGQLHTDERRRALGDLESELNRLAAEQVDPALPLSQRALIRAEMRLLLRDQKRLLDQLGAAYSSRIRALGDLEFERRQLALIAADFQQFLDQHLLWIPDAPAIGGATLRGVAPSLKWLFGLSSWAAVARTLGAELRDAPAYLAFGVLAFLLLWRARGGLARQLAHTAERVGHRYSDRFTLTVQALLITLLLALPWPLLAAVIGWRLQAAPGAAEFPAALGAALVYCAWMLLGLRALLRLCAPGGVAAAHFGWPRRTVVVLRANVARATVVLLPVTFLSVAFLVQSEPLLRYSVGRLALVGLLVCACVLLYRVLNPATGLSSPHLESGRDAWAARLRPVWFYLVVGAPIVIALLACVGYAYTAVKLSLSFHLTLWLMVAVVVVRDLAVRWLETTARRLAWLRAVEKRRSEATTNGSEGDPERPPEAALVGPDTPEMDFQTINEQSLRLLRTLIGLGVLIALWVIWSGVLPALGRLEEIALWHYSDLAGGQQTLVPVTLADMILVLALGFVVVVGAQNLPGVLEIALLQRLPMDPGTRNAITTVAQYTIVIAGVIAAFNALGIGWSHVQWMAAGVSVGLGFGLQEIFANFVCGLIILFERPVRIGDTVTVGEVTGTVSRIRIRATTIIDWDNKEIVVPNKVFITSQLTNWTLTDAIIRIVIRVGIAYGSDTQLAHRLMLETAEAEPLVLDQPEPKVLFVGLGDSSLDFDVHLFVKQITDRMPVVHAYHMAIERRLREHGIVIPFPQRDVHVRTVSQAPGLERAPRGDERKGEAAAARPLWERAKS